LDAKTMIDDPFDEIQNMILEDAEKRFPRRVIDLFMAPENFGVIDCFDYYSAIEGSCGETVVMYVAVVEERIDRISFVSDACGPTMACSSALTCMAKGQPLTEAARLTSGDLIDYLGGLPPDKTECAETAVKALQSVLAKALSHVAPPDNYRGQDL
jgi:NifU-like protein involved in Fe-S cluster formation